MAGEIPHRSGHLFTCCVGGIGLSQREAFRTAPEISCPSGNLLPGEIIDSIVIKIDRIRRGAFRAVRSVILIRGGEAGHRIQGFSGIDVILAPRNFDQVGELLLDVAAVPDVFQIKVCERLVGGIDVDCPGADDALPQAAGQREVGDAVEPDLVLPLIQKSGLQEQTVSGEFIDGECPWKAEKIALPVVP